MPALFSPISETMRGLRAYKEGVVWLKAHPRYLVLLFLPMLAGLLLFAYGWNVFLGYQDTIFDWALFAKPESYWLLPIYYVCKLVLYLAFFILGLVSMILLVNIFACPIYEIVSVAVEKDISGGHVEEIGIWDSLKLMGEEVKKVFFIFIISLILLFIPGLNIISTFITAFLLGWDYYDYAHARRGLLFKQRLRLVFKDFWAVMGLGLWLMIPFVQILLVPMAVAGGTILNFDSRGNLQRRIAS